MSISTLLTLLLCLFAFLVVRIYLQFLSSSQEQNAKKEDTDEDVLRRANMLFNSKKHAELQKYLKRWPFPVYTQQFQQRDLYPYHTRS